MAAIECPKEIQFETVVVDVCSHPNRDVIAAGDIDGNITVHSYSTSQENHLLLTLPPHKKSCRGLRFTPSGEKLLTISKDKTMQILDMNSGSLINKLKKAHESSLYSLLVANENIVATGDDDGTFKVWDIRLCKPVMENKEHEEFISDMVIDSNSRVLVATSGDGTLTAFDIRKHKKKLQSELFDSELLSIAKVKEENKAVVGTGEGALNIFNWGEWGNLSDRFPGHPMSVDCIVPLTDDIVVTGSMDGLIRAVHILPNRFLGVVGEHKDFPVENMTLSHCGHYLASCSHDQVVKFWNVDDVCKQKVSTKRKAEKRLKDKPLGGANSDFFSDLAAEEGSGKRDNESETESSDESETESSKAKKGRTSEKDGGSDTTNISKCKETEVTVNVKQDISEVAGSSEDSDSGNSLADDSEEGDLNSDSQIDSDSLNDSDVSSDSDGSEDDSEQTK